MILQAKSAKISWAKISSSQQPDDRGQTTEDGNRMPDGGRRGCLVAVTFNIQHSVPGQRWNHKSEIGGRITDDGGQTFHQILKR
jgi:hypothetical protein